MITYDRWTVEHIRWNKEKLLGIWGLLQRHPTLFSDLVRGDFSNFANSIIAEDTVLLEIKEGVVPLGYFKFTDMVQEFDCQAHAVFFDRKPVEKVPLGRLAAKWMFDNYPLRRITAEIPDIATWTIHFAERIGFKHEGIRRKAVPLKGQWRDVILLGLLREEAYGRS